MPAPTTLLLSGRGVATQVVGGKAAALDRLVAEGAPVPITGVITTEAYRCFITEAGLNGYLEELRAGQPPGGRDLSTATREVEAAFLRAPMPTRLSAQILRLADDVAQGAPLAIRSSATAEDTRSASFAGQYRSILDVRSHEDVLTSVRLVWASLWLPAPRAYRRVLGIDETDLTMAVVVMPLIPARLAGVVFTSDPGGRQDALRIEVVEGLGERLVSGEETPTAYVVPRHQPDQALADADPVLLEVVARALQIETWFSCPQDVEWAHDGERLHILQARPITTRQDVDDDGFDTQPRPGCTYTTAGIAEMAPGLLPPLLWTTFAPLLEEAFRRLFDQLGALPEDLGGGFALVGRLRGRAALNLDILKQVAASLPGGTEDDIERQYFGRHVGDGQASGTSAEPGAGGVRLAIRNLREIRVRHRFANEAELVIDCVDEVVGRQLDVERLTVPDLLAYRRRLVDLAGRVVAAELAVAAAATAAYQGIELLLSRHLPPEGASTWTQRLTSGGMHTCGGHMALAMCELVTDPARDEAIALSLDRDADAEEIRARLSGSAAGRALLMDLDALLHRAGSAAIFAGPTWTEQQDIVWQAIRQAIVAGHVVCPGCGSWAATCRCCDDGSSDGPRTSSDRLVAKQELERQLTRTWSWRLTRILTGQVVDLRKRMLRRLVADAFIFLDRRERTKTAVLRLGGEVRRTHMELGRRLVAGGVAGSPDDIDYLSSDELDAALRGEGPPRELLNVRRRRHETAAGEGPLPQRFSGRPAARPDRVLVGDVLEGWGGSPGRSRGVARVVDAPDTPIDPGQIIVARTTDPSWTPSFLVAKAIIVEEGGPLSHAAIVARELGIPAVLNLPGVVHRLGGASHDVTVDGTAGTVTIHDTVPPTREEAA